jgi:hypothetical protein|tara:strand:- start:17026 stop:19170 length:2145 start_codon:yes stop_codon:yes gene_type:complete
MAYGINGTLQVGIDPYGSGTTSLNRARTYGYSYSSCWSVNEPIRISVKWNGLNENQEPSPDNYNSATQKGDIVNILFEVYQISNSTGATFPDDWTKVGTIRKSRDIRNISQRDRVDGGDGLATSAGHIFTVDISEMCSDLLTYSLVPHGKGTYTSTFFGGLNGGAEQQGNRLVPVWSDNFIVTKHGAWRRIKVRMRAEIITDTGLIKLASASGSFKDTDNTLIIFNNAQDYDGNEPVSRHMLAAAYVHLGWGTTNRFYRSFQTNCPNGYWGGTVAYGNNILQISKDVRMDEAAEYLQWVMGTVNNYSIYYSGFDSGAGETKENPLNTSDLTDNVFIEVVAYDAVGAEVRRGRLFDFTQLFKPKETINGIAGIWPRNQYRMCAQNVSPVFINANIIHESSTVQDVWENGGQTYTRKLIDDDGNPSDKTALFLNDDIYYYRIAIKGVTTTQGNGTGVSKDYSEKRYYKIDRDRWLNTTPANSGDRYAGIYYTELRSDQMSLANPVRCKGFRWPTVIPNQTDFFRIHWLNKAGGIDSYTIKGQKSISYNAEKNIIQRKEPNRFDFRTGRSSGANPYPSNNAPTTGNYLSDYIGDTMNHKGGLEVLSVNATKSGTVTTLPLSQEKAEWLREILTSPNVWTENATMRPQLASGVWYKVAYRGQDDLEDGMSTDGRTPNNMEYVPIIITNSSVDVYNEQQGLVTMTFEYTHSHAVVTQRN